VHRAQVLLAAAQSPLLAEKKLASVLIPRLCNSILTAPSSSRHVSLNVPPSCNLSPADRSLSQAATMPVLFMMCCVACLCLWRLQLLAMCMPDGCLICNSETLGQRLWDCPVCCFCCSQVDAACQQTVLLLCIATISLVSYVTYHVHPLVHFCKNGPTNP